MIDIVTKECSKCKIEKLLTEFHKNKNTSDGVREICKLCANEKSALSMGKKRKKQPIDHIKIQIKYWKNKLKKEYEKELNNK